MLIPLLDAIIERSAEYGVREIVMGMPHRGRLNVLANILNKPYGMIFSEFEGNLPRDRRRRRRRQVPPRLLGRPRHGRQAHDPPLADAQPQPPGGRQPGRRGARCGPSSGGSRTATASSACPILIHGDAAFAGQGLVAETLNLSQLPGYRTGGTIHIVVNNQIGFTTAPERRPLDPLLHRRRQDDRGADLPRQRRGPRGGRLRRRAGARLPPDVRPGRRHRHGLLPPPRPQRGRRAGVHPAADVREDQGPDEHPRALHRAARDGRRALRATRPRRSPRRSTTRCRRSSRRSTTRHVAAPPDQPGFAGALEGAHARTTRSTPVETGVPYETLQQITEAIAAVPDGLHRQPQARARSLSRRVKAMEAKRAGRLGLRRGAGVRLAAAARGRRSASAARTAAAARSASGTPSWSTTRPASATSRSTTWRRGQAEFCVYDSLLSEAAVLGFDYGYSLDEPQHADPLGGPVRRLRQRRPGDHRPVHRLGRVEVGPRQRPGHAPAARLRRARGPSTPAPGSSGSSSSAPRTTSRSSNPTTPAQYFHLLRRQVQRNFRKPLIVMTPKSLLRHKLAVSPVDDSPRAGSARCSTTRSTPSASAGCSLCSRQGLLRPGRQARGGRQDARRRHRPPRAVLPLARRGPEGRARPLSRSAREWVWVQEESQNMGGWTFVAPRLHELMGDAVPVRRPRRQRQPGDRLAHGPRPRAGRARRGRHRRRRCPTWSPRTRSGAGRPLAVTARSELTMPAVPITVPGRRRVDLRGHPRALAQARRRRP